MVNLWVIFGRSPAGRAFCCNPSLRAERGNLLNIFLHKLATPGFPLQSLTRVFTSKYPNQKFSSAIQLPYFFLSIFGIFRLGYKRIFWFLPRLHQQ